MGSTPIVALDAFFSPKSFHAKVEAALAENQNQNNERR